MHPSTIKQITEDHRDSRRETTLFVLCLECMEKAFFTGERATQESVHYVYTCNKCGNRLEEIRLAVPQQIVKNADMLIALHRKLRGVVKKVIYG